MSSMHHTRPAPLAAGGLPPWRRHPPALRLPCRPGFARRQRPLSCQPPKAAAFQGEAAAPTTLSAATHTHYRLPEGWTQVLAVQVGVGCDLHGQSATKAAERACRRAIEFVDLHCVHDVVPGRYEGVKLQVKIACPNPGMVEICGLKECFPYGHMEIDVVEGGMRCSSCHVVPDLGEQADEMFVAVACVVVGW